MDLFFRGTKQEQGFYGSETPSTISLQNQFWQKPSFFFTICPNGHGHFSQQSERGGVVVQLDQNKTVSDASLDNVVG